MYDLYGSCKKCCVRRSCVAVQLTTSDTRMVSKDLEVKRENGFTNDNSKSRNNPTESEKKPVMKMKRMIRSCFRRRVNISALTLLILGDRL